MRIAGVDHAGIDLFSSIRAPAARGLACELKTRDGGLMAPTPPAMVYSDSPVILRGSVECVADSILVARWTGGELDLPLPTVRPDAALAETLRLLRGAKTIGDVESQYGPAPGGKPAGGAEARRANKRAERRLKDLGKEFGLMTRLTSLVAVVERAGDQAGRLPETRIVPVGTPADKHFDAYWNRNAPPCFGPGPLPPRMPPGICACMSLMETNEVIFDRSPKARSKKSGSFISDSPDAEASETEKVMETKEDLLTRLAAMLDSDGGLPGSDPAARLVWSLAAVAVFALHGHTATRGVFRAHVRRLDAFLEGGNRPALRARAAPARALFDALRRDEIPSCKEVLCMLKDAADVPAAGLVRQLLNEPAG